METVLPEVPAAGVQAVDLLRVEPVRASDGLCERVAAARRGDQVDVVGHQAVTIDRQAEPRGLVGQDLKVAGAVVVDKEHVLAVITALGDVMRTTRDDDPFDSRHSGILCRTRAAVKQKIGDCPLFPVRTSAACPYYSLHQLLPHLPPFLCLFHTLRNLPEPDFAHRFS